MPARGLKWSGITQRRFVRSNCPSRGGTSGSARFVQRSTRSDSFLKLGTITENGGNLLREFLRKKGIELTRDEIEKIREIKK